MPGGVLRADWTIGTGTGMEYLKGELERRGVGFCDTAVLGEDHRSQIDLAMRKLTSPSLGSAIELGIPSLD